MLVHCRITTSIKFAGTHLYTWVERGTVRVKCLAQEHNTMSPARALTRTARSGDERTNHEVIAPPKAPHKHLFTGTVFHKSRVEPYLTMSNCVTNRPCAIRWLENDRLRRASLCFLSFVLLGFLIIRLDNL